MGSSVRVENLRKEFATPSGILRAVDGVSFAIPEGATLGIVGESGSGKSTLGRCLLRLIEPTSGHVEIGGVHPNKLRPKQLREWRAQAQVVFQDPYGSVNPRLRVLDLVSEPLLLRTQLNGRERLERSVELLEMVRLDRSYLRRYPHELSGGQLQRVGIARALATHPGFVVLDEPTSSLDPSVRKDVLQLLMKLQGEFGLTYMLISHDLRTVRAHCDSVLVMYLGAVVEQGPIPQMFDDPQHPYTQALLSAELAVEGNRRRKRAKLVGEPSSPIGRRDGCRFADRCPIAVDACREEEPAHRKVNGGTAACLRIDDGTNKLE